MMSRCLSCGGPDNFHEPHCQQERDTLRAENARLRDELRKVSRTGQLSFNAAIERAEERDGYAAQSKRRGEALEDAATAVHSDRMHEGRFWDCERFGCSAARAAISPELAKEKEGT